MIVRILGEGQWNVEDGRLDALNELDDKVERAIDDGDEESFRTSMAALLAAVREAGSPMGYDTLVDSELILPMADASLAEVREMLADDGLIPG